METPDVNESELSLWRKIAINTGIYAGPSGEVVSANDNKLALLRKICLNLAALSH